VAILATKDQLVPEHKALQVILVIQVFQVILATKDRLVLELRATLVILA
jgi:hypothetical protein